MTSFTNTQHRGLFTCRCVVGQILQGVPALQHVGLLLQVLPVNTSCISCSARWWKIKLSPFSHLHPCFLLLSVAKGKKKAAGRVWGCHLLASLCFCKLPRTHLAWVPLSTKNNQHLSPRNSFPWIYFFALYLWLLQLFILFFEGFFFGEYFGEESIICPVHIPLWCLPHLGFRVVKSWCREQEEKGSLLS